MDESKIGTTPSGTPLPNPAATAATTSATPGPSAANSSFSFAHVSLWSSCHHKYILFLSHPLLLSEPQHTFPSSSVPPLGTSLPSPVSSFTAAAAFHNLPLSHFAPSTSVPSVILSSRVPCPPLSVFSVGSTYTFTKGHA